MNAHRQSRALAAVAALPQAAPIPVYRVATALAVAVLLLFALGCETANTVRPAHSNAVVTDVELEKITFNPGLDRRAFVRSVSETSTNGLMRVQVNLANRDTSAGTLKDAIFRATVLSGEAGKTKQRGFNYRFTWMDAEGFVIDDPTAPGWTQKLLSTGEYTTIAAIAPSPKAVDWQLTMQPWTGY